MKHRSSRAIPIIEETAYLEKREVETGKVRVQTAVDVVQELVKGNLVEESVSVSRVPVGRDIEQAPTIRTEGDVVIIPIVEEVLVVEKRLRLKEEIHVRRRVDTRPVEMPVSLRKQRAVVTREAGQGGSAPKTIARPATKRGR
jgi:stress response protein YsnF